MNKTYNIYKVGFNMIICSTTSIIMLIQSIEDVAVGYNVLTLTGLEKVRTVLVSSRITFMSSRGFSPTNTAHYYLPMTSVDMAWSHAK